MQGQSFSAAGFTSTQPFENVLVFVLILVVFILVIFIMVCLTAIEKYRNKIKEKLVSIYKEMIWSGLIKSVMLTYLKNFVTFYLACLLLMSADSTQRDVLSILITVIIGIPLVFFPFWSIFFLWRKQDMFSMPAFKQKYGGMYNDLHQNYSIHSPWCMIYPAVFTLRRVSFVLIAIIPFSYVFFNIVTLIISNVVYTSWL